MKSIHPVILSGGSGTRLWPRSRRDFPKQFLHLIDDRSLFQKTCMRLSDPLYAAPSVLSNHDHRFLVAEQLQELGLKARTIVLEPIVRNTAPAALIASLLAMDDDPEQLLLLLPSDHVVSDEKGFANSISKGIEAAEEGHIVTFGIRPDGPETGYGYIETAKGTVNGRGGPADVIRFVEKPDQKTAQAYLDDGGFYWNAGIFLFSANTMVEAFNTHAPDLVGHCREAIENAVSDPDFLRLDETSYAGCKNISLDYAIMEKVSGIKCVPLEADWSDLGSWPAVWQVMDKDDKGNVADGDVILEGATNSYAHSVDGACLALVGVKDIIAVATKDAILIASKEHAQDVSKVVDQLKAQNRTEHISHVRDYRPWGWFERLSIGDGYQVKCLMVKPGGQLSLQSHKHRAEHWVVVSGTAQVTNGDDVFSLEVNQSTYIPLGNKHRLENFGDVPLLLIEVQTGSYLGEDDIVRYEDVYGRDKNG